MDIGILAQIDTSQIMEQVSTFFEALRPETLGDFMIYIVFFFSLITTFLLPDGNDLSANLLYGTIVLAIFNLTVGEEWYNDANVVIAFPAFMARVAMFLLPLIAAGAVRARKKGKLALPMGIVAGVFGMLYAFLSFFAPAVTDIVLF